MTHAFDSFCTDHRLQRSDVTLAASDGAAVPHAMAAMCATMSRSLRLPRVPALYIIRDQAYDRSGFPPDGAGYDSGQHRIALKESTADAILAGDARALYNFCHALGHAVPARRPAGLNRRQFLAGSYAGLAMGALGGTLTSRAFDDNIAASASLTGSGAAAGYYAARATIDRTLHDTQVRQALRADLHAHHLLGDTAVEGLFRQLRDSYHACMMEVYDRFDNARIAQELLSARRELTASHPSLPPEQLDMLAGFRMHSDHCEPLIPREPQQGRPHPFLQAGHMLAHAKYAAQEAAQGYSR